MAESPAIAMSATARELQARLASLSDPGDAKNLSWFFKTGKGEYGEGDLFRGIRVPVLRKLAKESKDAPLPQVATLLESPHHEDRMLAVIMLVNAFQRGTEAEQKGIYHLYLSKTDRINNWDLVDISCHHVVGAYLLGRSRAPLYKLVKSESLWERRIAIVSTHQFIRHGQLDDTFRIAEALLADRHDLIHKAAGWMLREAGKRDVKAMMRFLDKFKSGMPRTMLRYAIERLPEAKRKAYMAK